MASHYCVLQYAPRPLSGERVNFGVVCFDDDNIRARVVSNWSKVSGFSRQDVQFLKDFASRLLEAVRRIETAPGTSLPPAWTRDDLVRMAQRWSHSIQLTPPRASLLTVEQFLDTVYDEFVDEPTRNASEGRGRKEARLELTTAVRGALSSKLSDMKIVRSLLRRDRIEGRAEVHPFDVIAGNGSPAFVAHALSFESDATTASENQLRSLAFRIEDVKKLQPQLRFAIFALPPCEGLATSHSVERLGQARTIMESIGTEVVEEASFESWVAPLVDDLVAHAVN